MRSGSNRKKKRLYAIVVSNDNRVNTFSVESFLKVSAKDARQAVRKARSKDFSVQADACEWVVIKRLDGTIASLSFKWMAAIYSETKNQAIKVALNMLTNGNHHV